MPLIDGDDAARIDTLRFIEDKAKLGVWTWEIAADRLHWSPGAYSLLGLSPGAAEPSFALLESMQHPDDRRRRGELRELLLAGFHDDWVFRIIRPDGTLRWIENRSETLFDTRGKPLRVLGVMIDTTAAEEARNASRINETYFRALLRASGALVWTADAHGSVTDMPGYQEVRSDRVDQFLGASWHNMIHPDDQAATIGAWRTAVECGSRFFVEVRVRQSDGSYHWHRANAVPIRAPDGTTREFLGVAIDVQNEKKPPRPSNAAARLSGAQIRAGRAILRWSVRRLAEAASISTATIRRLEEQDSVSSGDAEVLRLIEDALSAAGVDFFFPAEGRPGAAPR